MKCEELRDELIAYLKDELDEERKKEIEEHMVRCQGCQRELEAVKRMLSQAQAANESSVVEMLDGIIRDAIQKGASDIHIDPTREGADIRFRIDGVLQPMMQLALPERDALITRIKLIGGMNVMETRIPQDGRICTKSADLDQRLEAGLFADGADIRATPQGNPPQSVAYDLRVSIVPFVFGTKAVMRILNGSSSLIGLDNLGLLPEQLEMVRNLIKEPSGMIVVTGPSGAGKTTTLYSMLTELRNPGINIMTVEDPVEYMLTGIQQAQVHPAAGYTFATALRTFLRQDPDVIMAGEIRDLESAEIALQAAITGHLVLTVFHTADAASGAIRMIDVGLEPYLVKDSLLGIIAQSLARKSCLHCREEYTPSDEALEHLGLKEQIGKAKFHRGVGCAKCNHTGYRGRTGVFEVLLMDREIGEMLLKRCDLDSIRKCAIANGFITMTEAGKQKVLEGITTAEEVCRVLHRR